MQKRRNEDTISGMVCSEIQGRWCQSCGNWCKVANNSNCNADSVLSTHSSVLKLQMVGFESLLLGTVCIIQVDLFVFVAHICGVYVITHLLVHTNVTWGVLKNFFQHPLLI